MIELSYARNGNSNNERPGTNVFGVIFGKDLRYSFDTQNWIGDRSISADSVVKRSKDNFPGLVKNTYRILLSRGLKGCYVYFQDKETERFFKSRMEI